MNFRNYKTISNIVTGVVLGAALVCGGCGDSEKTNTQPLEKRVNKSYSGKMPSGFEGVKMGMTKADLKRARPGIYEAKGGLCENGRDQYKNVEYAINPEKGLGYMRIEYSLGSQNVLLENAKKRLGEPDSFEENTMGGDRWVAEWIDGNISTKIIYCPNTKSVYYRVFRQPTRAEIQRMLKMSRQ
jgi:hypothetical protein